MFSKKSLVVTIVAIAALYSGYRFFFGQGPGGMPMGGMPVSVAEVIEREVQQWNEFSGRLVAVDQVEIRPQVSGIIDTVHFKDGAMVNKGDMLFTIDPRPYQAAIEAARATYVYAEAEHRRAANLLKDKAIPKREADEKFNAYQVAKAALTRAQLDLDYTAIRSPITGRVSRAEITVGNLVNVGMPVLTTVVSSTPIYADFDIDEHTFLQYAKAGVSGGDNVSQIPVVMEAGNDGGVERSGHVQSFDNKLDEKSGTVRVRAVFDNEGGALVPGLFVRLKLGSPENTKALLIADRAVGTDQSKKFAYVVGEDNKVAYREIKIGASADGMRIVREGLASGEKIIVSSFLMLRPGMPVDPKVVPMDAKEAPQAAPEASAETKP